MRCVQLVSKLWPRRSRGVRLGYGQSHQMSLVSICICGNVVDRPPPRIYVLSYIVNMIFIIRKRNEISLQTLYVYAERIVQAITRLNDMTVADGSFAVAYRWCSRLANTSEDSPSLTSLMGSTSSMRLPISVLY